MALTKHGKRTIAISQFEKGCAFIGAAYLMRPHALKEPQQYVVLHLVCQGIELITKGILLARDFDTYRPRQRRFGHNIELLIDEAINIFDLKPLKPHLKEEIKYLADRFKAHQLRYASVVDIMIDPSSIEYDLILRKLHATIRLARRQLVLV